MRIPTERTTLARAESFDVTRPLLQSMYDEFKELSKKKPEAALSKGKVKIVNRLLERVREVLAGEASMDFLDILDDDDIPQNSDVVLMLSQYVASMVAFKEKYYGYNGSQHDWFVK
ncbi:MAG: hypothetical protein KKB56_17585 [Gammaproteobacteria bacterium]|nr:hypothetical protein [Alphaproteobacteria bacterium]MBU1774993.1 hypothetical protein [Gammaproteobacteria bacterium]